MLLQNVDELKRGQWVKIKWSDNTEYESIIMTKYCKLTKCVRVYIPRIGNNYLVNIDSIIDCGAISKFEPMISHE